jgi:hypothetical protein
MCRRAFSVGCSASDASSTSRATRSERDARARVARFAWTARLGVVQPRVHDRYDIARGDPIFPGE